MKTPNHYFSMFIVLILMVISLTLLAEPMGMAFTYQGRLLDNNIPAEGIYEMEFRLYDSAADPSLLLGTFSLRDVDVVDGFFTAQLDFGSNVFNGDARWLEIGTRPADTTDPFETLSPRQELTPTPYALQTRGIFVDDMLNVGIGTTSPEAKLDIANASAGVTLTLGRAFGEPSIKARSDANAGWLIMDSTDSGKVGLNYYHDADVILANGGGNVGIGTTSPSSPLHIWKGSSSSPVLRLDTQKIIGELTLTERLFFDGSDIDAEGTLGDIPIHLNSNSSGDVSLAGGGGKVGIGTMSPTSKLQVAGDLKVDGNIHATNMPGCEYGEFPDYSNLPLVWTNVGSISLTLPESGYVIVTFTGTAYIIDPGIASIAIGGSPASNNNYGSTICDSDYGTQFIPFCVQHTRYCNVGDGGGTVTYYGNANASMGGANLSNMQMTAIYVPVRY